MTTFSYKTKIGKLWGYHFQANQRRYLRRGYATEKKARGECEKHREQVDLGRIGRFRSFSELATAWLTDLGHRQTKDWTRQCELKLNKLVPDWQDTPPEKITPHHVALVLQRVKGRAGKPPAPATVNEARKILSACFHFAVRLGALIDNPVRPVRRLGEPQEEPKIIPTEEFRKLLSAADPELRQFLCLLAATGARQMEIGFLKVADVFLEDPPYVIVRSRKNHGGGVRSRRQYLPPNAVEALRERLAAGVTDWVFPGRRKPVTARGTWQKRLYRACDDAEIPRHGFHDVRRWAGTMAMLSGASEAQVAKFLGHADTRSTRRYMRVEDEAALMLAEKVTGALDKPRDAAADAVPLETN